MILSNRKKIFFILSIIIITATIFAIISYAIFSQTEDSIEKLAIDNLKINSEIEAQSISSILSYAISSIGANLQILANSPAVIEGNISRVQTMLDIAQYTTSNLTDLYYLLDGNGKLLTYSNLDEFNNYAGIDLSHRDYFQVPMQNNTMYISTVIDSNDRIPRMYISLPIVAEGGDVSSQSTNSTNGLGLNQTDRVPSGVIVAGIAATALGDLLQNQIHPQFSGSVGFFDRKGTILHSQNETFVGKNYFEGEFQSLLKSTLGQKIDEFNDIINRSLFLQNGQEEFDFENTTTTVAYEAVNIATIGKIDNNNSSSISSNINNHNRAGTLFITTPNSLAANVSNLINIQEVTNIFIIFAIVLVSLFAAIVVLRWNVRLQKIVHEKTMELQTTIKQLKESNEKLNLTRISLEKSNTEILITNSKLRNANQSLELHDKMQKEFINIAAHELRTPIQAITGNLELIEMAYLPSLFQTHLKRMDGVGEEFEILLKNKERLYEFFERLVAVFRNSKRLEKLVYDLLDVSRIEIKNLEMHNEFFNLNEKIKNVINDLGGLWSHLSEDGTKTIQPNIIFNTCKDPIIVYADKIRIYEVISNLLTNAMEFSRNNDHKLPIIVSVSISNKDDLQDNERSNLYKNKKGSDDLTKSDKIAVVSVKDRGKGIDEKILPRLFTKFTTGSFSGTGLGLYIAKHIVESHGGKIWAKNNNDDIGEGGGGATFSFSIPLVDRSLE